MTETQWLEEIIQKMSAPDSWGPKHPMARPKKEEAPIPLQKKMENGKAIWEGKPVTIEGTYKPEHPNKKKAREDREKNKQREYDPAPPAPVMAKPNEPDIIVGQDLRKPPAPNKHLETERIGPKVKAEVDRLDGQLRQDVESRSSEVREALKKVGPKDLSWSEIEAYLQKGKEDDKKEGPDLMAAALISLIPTAIGGMMGGLGGAAAGAKGGAAGVNHLIEKHGEKTKGKQDDRMKALELQHKINQAENDAVYKNKKLLVDTAQAEIQVYGKVTDATKQALKEVYKADAGDYNKAGLQDDRQDYDLDTREDKQAHDMDKQSQQYQANVLRDNLRTDQERHRQQKDHENKMTQAEKQNNAKTGQMTIEHDHEFNVMRQRHQNALELQKLKPKGGAKGPPAAKGAAKQTEKFGEDPIPGYEWNGKTYVSAGEMAKLRKAAGDLSAIDYKLDKIKDFIRKTPKQDFVKSPTVQDDLKLLLSDAMMDYKSDSFAQLGVPTGKDMEIMEGAIQNPSEWRKMVQKPDAIIARYGSLYDGLKQKVDAKMRYSGFTPIEGGSVSTGSPAKPQGGVSTGGPGYKDGDERVTAAGILVRVNGKWKKKE